MNLKNILLIIPMLFFNTACVEENRSIVHLCQNNPTICYKMNPTDGQCRQERSQLIWFRHGRLTSTSELADYEELLLTRNYANCMELAAQIESTTLKSKKTQRTDSLLEAYASIDNIEKKLENTIQPRIIYHRWTHGDETALEKFLALEETEHLNTPELQFSLATYYADKDLPHTISLLKKGLTFFNNTSPPQTRKKTLPDIIRSLATSTHAKKNYDEAYMWALIGKQFNIPVVNEKQLRLLYPMTSEKRKKVAQIAEKVGNKIDKGEFTEDLLTPLNSPN